MTSLLVLHGPNLGLLGTRQPEIYGHETLADHIATVTAAAAEHGWDVADLQSDHEGDLVAAIGAARTTHDAILINGGAFTHYSWAIHDALAAFDGPVVEIHLSNPAARESWRHTSVITPVADGVIAGFGGTGYALAVDAIAQLLAR